MKEKRKWSDPLQKIKTLNNHYARFTSFPIYKLIQKP